MAHPLFKEKRFRVRKMLTGLLPGPLLNAQGQSVNCKPVDISEFGLGILTSDLLSEGDQLTLNIPNNPIPLIVTWGKRDFGKHNLFRYGLQINGDYANLEELFLASGCLK